MKGTHKLVNVLLMLMMGQDNTRPRRVPGYLQRTTPAQRQAVIDRMHQIEADVPREQIEQHMLGIDATFRAHWAEYWRQYKSLTPDVQALQDMYLSDVLRRFHSRVRLEAVLADAPDAVREQYLGKG